MISQYVFLDIDTQHDFLDAQGLLPVVNHEVILPSLRKVFSLAKKYHVPIISSMESHRPWELIGGRPQPCMDDTQGHKKLHFTLLRQRTLLETTNTLDVPDNLLGSYRQIILRRRTQDFLDNPKADHLISSLESRTLVLFGVGVERTIKRLAHSLVAREKSVILLPEACGYWNETDADLSYRLIQAKGGQIRTLAELADLLQNSQPPRIPRVYSQPPTLFARFKKTRRHRTTHCRATRR